MKTALKAVIMALLVLMTAAAVVHMSEGSEAKTVDPTDDLGGGTVYMNVGDELRKDFSGNQFTYTLVLRSVTGAPWLKAYNVGESDRGYILGTATSAGTWDVALTTEIWHGGNQSSSESVTQNFTVAVGQSPGDTMRRVTFNTNGGDGSTVSWSVLSGNTIELPTDLFSRAGYMLAGWSTSETASTGTFGERTVAADVTLYAVWKALPADDPGHSHYRNASAPSHCGRGSTYDYSSPTSDWAFLNDMINGVPSNLVFSGPSWMTFSCGSDLVMRFGGTPVDAGNYLVKVTTKRTADYYIWWTVNVPSAADSVSELSFSPGQGTGSHASVSAPEGTAVVLPSADSGFSRPGYALAAFSTQISGTTVYYPLSSIYTFTDKDAAMTAFYVADRGVMIFDANGGICEQGVQAFIAQTDGAVTLPSSGYSKAGCVPIGWRFSNDPGGPVYAPGYLYRMGAVSPSTVMTMAWASESDTLVKVTFDANGGSAAGPGSASVPVGTAIALPMTGYSKEGKTFSGWNTSQTGNGTHYGPGSAMAVSGAVRLYAEWTSGGNSGGTETSHTVVFALNGGSGSVPSQQVDDGAKAKKPADPSLDRYAFLGWQRVGDTAVWDFSTPVTSDMVLRAMWKEIFSMKVSDTKVTVKLSPGFYGKSATVDWCDGSPAESFTTSVGHDYPAGSSGRFLVSLHSGEKSYCHYSVGSSGSSAIKFVDGAGKLLKSVSVSTGSALSEENLLILLGDTGQKISGLYMDRDANERWGDGRAVTADVTVWVAFDTGSGIGPDLILVAVSVSAALVLAVAAVSRRPALLAIAAAIAAAAAIYYKVIS